jgi:hypothetical protein
MQRISSLISLFILAFACGLNPARAAFSAGANTSSAQDDRASSVSASGDFRGLHALIADERGGARRYVSPASSASEPSHLLSIHDREVLRRQILEQSRGNGAGSSNAATRRH